MSAGVYKMLGAAVVFVSAFVLERGLCGRQKAVTAQIVGFLTLFRALRSGIAYYRAPLKDILARTDVNVLAACSGTGTAARGDSLSAVIDNCVFLSDGLMTLMQNAAGELGRGYRDEQLAACDRYLAALEELHQESLKKESERSKLIGTLIFAAAATVVILLM